MRRVRLRFVTIELIQQRRRARRAERIVRQDMIAMSLAYDRFLREVVASPAGLAASAALGFSFGRARSASATSGGVTKRLSSLATLLFWVRRLLAPASTAFD